MNSPGLMRIRIIPVVVFVISFRDNAVFLVALLVSSRGDEATASLDGFVVAFGKGSTVTGVGFADRLVITTGDEPSFLIGTYADSPDVDKTVSAGDFVVDFVVDVAFLGE
jgi:hypothetical protein